MHTIRWLLFSVLVLGPVPFALAQDATNDLVREAVQTELGADQTDHSRWLYLDVDMKPGDGVRQWVAETGHGTLRRVLEQKGRALGPDEQRRQMDGFVRDASAQEKQRKSDEHDAKQAAEMLRLLPEGFVWTRTGEKDGVVTLHFKPNPSFKAPSWSSRVFAAMEGDMAVNEAQKRIARLNGRLIRDVKFCGGLCGNLSSGGTFGIERREVEPGIWQITEMHVHIHGSALFFKSISQAEDETKSHFKRLPDAVTLAEAEKELMAQAEK